MINDKFLISSAGLFVFYNFITIVIALVIYFFIKEFYRIKRNNPSTFSRVFIGSAIGIFIMISLIFVNFALDIKFAPIVPSGWGGIVQDGLVPITTISPFIIFLILFPALIDGKLMPPILVFSIIGTVITIPWTGDEIINNVENWSTMIIMFLSLIMISILIYIFEFNNLFKKNGIKVLIYFILWIVIMFLSKIVQGIIIAVTNEIGIAQYVTYTLQVLSIETAYLLIILIFTGVFIYIIERIYDNYNKLESFTASDNASYFKMALSKDKLKSIIDTQRINFGFLILLDIETKEEEIKSQALLELKYRTEFDYKEPFFFRATTKYYGIFLPANERSFSLSELIKNNDADLREGNDFLSKFDASIKEISNTKECNISAAASIYGLHSYDVNDLIEQSSFLLNPIVRRVNMNNIIVYDFNRVKNRLEEKNKVTNLPIEINALTFSYLRAVNEETIFYPSITYEANGERKELYELEKSNFTPESKEHIIRYCAYQSARNFKKADTSLVVYYPTSYLSNQMFDANNFEKKINRFLNNENIIIGVAVNGIKSKKILKDNLNKLRSKGFRLSLIHSDKITQDKVDLIKPDFILDIEEKSSLLKIKEKKITYKTDAVRLNSHLVL